MNTTWGHHGGDLVLQRVAKLLKSHVRNSDVVCRWSGEEFLMVLENCDLPEALELAQGISQDVKNLEIPFGRERLRVTVSAGLARLQPGDTREALTARIDGALHKAREAGQAE